MREQSIIITPVANGFLVEMPMRISSQTIPGIDQILGAVKKFQRGLTEGEDWKDKIEDAENILNQIKPLDVDQNTHVFKTFPEVLEFLDGKFIN